MCRVPSELGVFNLFKSLVNKRWCECYAIVGLKCRSSPILKALNVPKIDNVVETSSLKLISAIFSNSSRAKTFYCYLLKNHCCDQLRNHTDLIARVRTICCKHNVSLFKYILDTSYAQSTNFHQIIHYAGRRIM